MRTRQLLREALAPLGIAGARRAARATTALAAPERHLGLVPAAEREPRARARARRAGRGDRARTCDLDAVRRARAHARRRCAGDAWTPAPRRRAAARARIAIAARSRVLLPLRGEPRAAARAPAPSWSPFDPLDDEQLPPRTDALMLAGGFPEVFGAELSANAALRAEIAAFARAGRPILAECGGLLYLCDGARRAADVRRDRRRRAR